MVGIKGSPPCRGPSVKICQVGKSSELTRLQGRFVGGLGVGDNFRLRYFRYCLYVASSPSSRLILCLYPNPFRALYPSPSALCHQAWRNRKQHPRKSLSDLLPYMQDPLLRSLLLYRYSENEADDIPDRICRFCVC